MGDLIKPWAVGCNVVVTVHAGSQAEAEQIAKDMVRVSGSYSVMDWEPAISYDPCEVPGCECPSVVRVPTGDVDRETGYVEEVVVCKEHAR